jgi:hypothetical protein
LSGRLSLWVSRVLVRVLLLLRVLVLVRSRRWIPS